MFAILHWRFAGATSAKIVQRVFALKHRPFYHAHVAGDNCSQETTVSHSCRGRIWARQHSDWYGSSCRARRTRCCVELNGSFSSRILCLVGSFSLRGRSIEALEAQLGVRTYSQQGVQKNGRRGQMFVQRTPGRAWRLPGSKLAFRSLDTLLLELRSRRLLPLSHWMCIDQILVVTSGQLSAAVTEKIPLAAMPICLLNHSTHAEAISKEVCVPFDSRGSAANTDGDA